MKALHSKYFTILVIALVLVSVGCQQDIMTPTAVPGPPTLATATLAPVATTQPTITPTLVENEPQREIVIIHTSDEHGMLLPEKDNDFVRGGAGVASSSWKNQGLDPTTLNGNVLLLSGGDNWMGSAISTWFEGESTIEVMNAMAYRASILGNHEFDQGQEVLRQRLAQADFPYLAANIYQKGTDQLSDLAQPYLVATVNGIKVGVIGLALKGTPGVTAAKNIADLTFGDYEPALRRWVPVVRQEGAQVVIAETHICPQDLALLAAQVADLKIDLFQGGHCHSSRLTTAGDALVASGSAYWRDYIVTRLVYDLDRQQIVKREQELVDVLYMGNTLPPPDKALDPILAKWQEQSEAILGEVIGYTQSGLPQHSTLMHNMLVDSWLWSFDTADVAISNSGGFRQAIAKGEITLADIVGVFPFDNVIYELNVTGKDLISAVRSGGADIVIGGMALDAEGKLITLRDGLPIDPNASYRLLTTDYMYHNTKYPYHDFDKEPYDTSIHWRQPVVDWLRAQASSDADPIESRIAADARN